MKQQQYSHDIIRPEHHPPAHFIPSHQQQQQPYYYQNANGHGNGNGYQIQGTHHQAVLQQQHHQIIGNNLNHHPGGGINLLSDFYDRTETSEYIELQESRKIIEVHKMRRSVCDLS
jgi:hypothetical protein